MVLFRTDLGSHRKPDADRSRPEIRSRPRLGVHPDAAHCLGAASVGSLHRYGLVGRSGRPTLAAIPSGWQGSVDFGWFSLLRIRGLAQSSRHCDSGRTVRRSQAGLSPTRLGFACLLFAGLVILLIVRSRLAVWRSAVIAVGFVSAIALVSGLGILHPLSVVAGAETIAKSRPYCILLLEATPRAALLRGPDALYHG